MLAWSTKSSRIACLTACGLSRLSNAAEKAAEARNRLSGGSIELNAMVLPQVKGLSEDMANVLKSRNSWTATVAPFPNAMKVGVLVPDTSSFALIC